MHELDIVVLTHDIPEHGLRRGDAGTIVYCHRGGQAAEVEFITTLGETIAVLTLENGDMAPAPPGGPYQHPEGTPAPGGESRDTPASRH